MDNSSPLQVKISGWLPWQGWCDYGQGWFIFPCSPLYTFTRTKSGWILVFLGICFGCAQPYVESIVTHILGWGAYALTHGLKYARDRYWTRACNPEHPSETDQLLTTGQTAPEEEDQRSPRPLRYCCRLPTRVVVARLVAFVVLTAGIAWQIAGAFVSQIPTKSAALSASRNCGVWGLIDDALPDAQDEDALIQGQKETRAAQYARNCYGPESATSLDQCLVFSETNIPLLSRNETQQCPFENETYCVGDGFTAVSFTTGLTDSKYIGLNKPDLPMFNRTTVCVPLNIHLDPGFVEKTSDLPGHWGYKLGPVSSDVYKSNYTFLQYGDPFTFDVRAYTMSTYVHVYSKSASQNYWTPIPELNIRSALNSKSAPYSLTLMFINSCRIFYKEPSTDPIFPADQPWRNNLGLWTNSDSRARPLACIDWIEVCQQDRCRPTYEDEPVHKAPYAFTRFALNKSTTFHAIEFRGATGLDAQDRIKGDTSLPLHKDPPQWILESQNLFSASLSRAQYDAMDIAIGAGSDKHTYDQKMPAWVQGKLCDMFKFQLPKDYQNVGFGITFISVAIPLFLVVIGLETGQKFSQHAADSGWFGKDRLLSFEVAIAGLVGCFRKCCCRRPSKTTNPDSQQPEGNDSQHGGQGGNDGDIEAPSSLPTHEPPIQSDDSNVVRPNIQPSTQAGSSRVQTPKPLPTTQSIMDPEPEQSAKLSAQAPGNNDNIVTGASTPAPETAGAQKQGIPAHTKDNGNSKTAEPASTALPRAEVQSSGGV